MTDTEVSEPQGPRKPGGLQHILFSGITALYFVYLYYRLNGPDVREGFLPG